MPAGLQKDWKQRDTLDDLQSVTYVPKSAEFRLASLSFDNIIHFMIGARRKANQSDVPIHTRITIPVLH